MSHTKLSFEESNGIKFNSNLDEVKAQIDTVYTSAPVPHDDRVVIVTSSKIGKSGRKLDYGFCYPLSGVYKVGDVYITDGDCYNRVEVILTTEQIRSHKQVITNVRRRQMLGIA